MAIEAPRIAVLLDENTSGDGRRYEADKRYFRCVADAGGLPFGIPYLAATVGPTVRDFEGLLAVGGRFAYPHEWYAAGERSRAKPSERLGIERALMEGFLARDKPVLGICAGMQMLGCLHGCRLTADLRAGMPQALQHDDPSVEHAVAVTAGTRLHRALAVATMTVNSFHREALVEIGPGVAVAARSPDGIVEAIEIPHHSFAVGLQWHQERFAGLDHPGQRVFAAFVAAASARDSLPFYGVRETVPDRADEGSR